MCVGVCVLARGQGSGLMRGGMCVSKLLRRALRLAPCFCLRVRPLSRNLVPQVRPTDMAVGGLGSPRHSVDRCERQGDIEVRGGYGEGLGRESPLTRAVCVCVCVCVCEACVPSFLPTLHLLSTHPVTTQSLISRPSSSPPHPPFQNTPTTHQSQHINHNINHISVMISISIRLSTT